MMRLRVAVGLLLSLGCVQHVTLQRAPPRGAPLAHRAAAWERLRPTGLGYTDVVGVRGGAMVSGGATVEREFDRIVLRGGVEVRAPEDLLPALDEGSAAAQAASRAGVLRDVRDVTELGGAVLLLGSLLAIPIASAVIDGDGGAAGTALLTSGAVGLGSLLLGALVFRPLAGSARQEAFEGYGAGLRDRLGVCQCIGVLCDCRTGEIAAPAPGRPSAR